MPSLRHLRPPLKALWRHLRPLLKALKASSEEALRNASRDATATNLRVTLLFSRFSLVSTEV